MLIVITDDANNSVFGAARTIGELDFSVVVGWNKWSVWTYDVKANEFVNCLVTVDLEGDFFAASNAIDAAYTALLDYYAASYRV